MSIFDKKKMSQSNAAAQDRFEDIITKNKKISNSCQYCKQHKAMATG